MPTAEQILEGLRQISNNFQLFAVIWHIILFGMIAGLLTSWKPSNKLLSSLLGIPLLSVSTFAWIEGNPFNGTLFLVFGILLLLVGIRNNDQPVWRAPSFIKWLGILIIAYGLIYPHFLEVSSIFQYVYAAPSGLVPCPTLSVVIGFAVVYRGFQSGLWTGTLLVAGLIYGMIGVFRLHVLLDAGLLLANLALIISYFSFRYEKKKSYSNH